MIIWIDGATGVGKSHVAAKLAEVFEEKIVEYIESDLYWFNWIKKNLRKALSGFNPYTNKYFLDELRNALEEKNQLGITPIVSMSLVDKLCETELLDYFEVKKLPMIHIILEASKEEIILRIKNDCSRDQVMQSEQIENVEWQVDYLEGSDINAIRVCTENRSIKEIVEEIKNYLSENWVNGGRK